MRHLGLCILVCGAALALCAPSAGAKSAIEQATDLELEAMDLQQAGNLDAAIAKHREAVQICPQGNPQCKAYKQNLAEALNTAGVAKYTAKDYVTAIADFQEALANVPNFNNAKQNLAIAQGEKLNAEGMVLFKNSDFAGAVEKFKAALAAQPGYKNALVNRDAAEAEIAINAGDFATAVAKLQEAVSVAPTQFLQDKLAKAQASLAEQQAKAAKEQQQKH
jgi:tetratricopeptide (TPR) repeat protein